MSTIAGFPAIPRPMTLPPTTAVVEGKLYATLVAGVIVYLPLASGLRGFSQQLGQVALLAGDTILVALFLVALAGARRITTVDRLFAGLLVFLGLYCVLYPMVTPYFPEPLVAYQGFRKSVVWLLAIYVGRSVEERYRSVVITTVFWTCLAVCAYGIKQIFYFSDFDRALLDVQSAGEYANQISGQQRAISVLSSGFHLGMAGCLVVCIAFWSQGKSLWLRAIAIAMGIAAVYASITRTFMVIIATLFVIRLLLSRPALALAAVTLGIVVMLVLAVDNVSVIDMAFDIISGDDRFTNRLQSYVAFWSYLGAYPHGWFLGFGPGSAGSTLGADFYSVNAPWIEPHNIFSKYIFEFGLPVALLVWSVVVAVTRRARAAGHYQPAIAWALLATIVISGLTITSVEASPVSLYIGLIIGALSKEPSRAEGIA